MLFWPKGPWMRRYVQFLGQNCERQLFGPKRPKTGLFGQKDGRGGHRRRYRRGVPRYRREEESSGLCPCTPWSHFFGVLGSPAGVRQKLLIFGRQLLNFGPKTAQNGPFLAVFREFIRREGPKSPEKRVDRSLYLYGPCAFDRVGF